MLRSKPNTHRPRLRIVGKDDDEPIALDPPPVQNNHIVLIVGLATTCLILLTVTIVLYGFAQNSSRVAMPVCLPEYPDTCIPSGRKIDCKDITARNFRAFPPDSQHLDGNHNGIACEQK